MSTNEFTHSKTPAAPRLLTKARFVLAAQCPAKLNYCDDAAYADVATNDFLRTLADGGNSVGAFARACFPGGTEVTGADPAAQVQATRALLAQPGDLTLFEAAFEHEGQFARVDVLRRVGGRLDVLEVKASGVDPSAGDALRGPGGTLKSTMLPYVLDLAFQVHVLRQALPGQDIRPGLVLLDNTHRSRVDGLAQRFAPVRVDSVRGEALCVDRTPGQPLDDHLLVVADARAAVDELLGTPQAFGALQGTVGDIARDLALALRRGERLPARPIAACSGCEFRASGGGATLANGAPRCALSLCWSGAGEGGVLVTGFSPVVDLHGSRRIQGMLDRGLRGLHELEPSDLVGAKPNKSQREALARLPQVCSEQERPISSLERQWLQILSAKAAMGVAAAPVCGSVSGATRPPLWVFRRVLARQGIASWRFPLNLIDFETARPALPSQQGQTPYSLVAFQFSHHVLEADGRVTHAGDFLQTGSGVGANIAFLGALRASLSRNAGSVMMWSPYENSVLCEIIEQWSAVTAGAAAGVDRALPASVMADVPGLVAFARTLVRQTLDDGAVVSGARAMIDLCDLFSRVFFHERTQGSNSIKKVLPALLSCVPQVAQRYTTANYGGSFGNSRNFREPVAWCVSGPDGQLKDPYELLGATKGASGVEPAIAVRDGGAALAAYALLQQADTSNQQRGVIADALKRYCELDTLAMVMCVQGMLALARSH